MFFFILGANHPRFQISQTKILCTSFFFYHIICVGEKEQKGDVSKSKRKPSCTEIYKTLIQKPQFKYRAVHHNKNTAYYYCLQTAL